MTIEQLQLSARAYNCLKRRGIQTAEQVAVMKDKELLRIRHFGTGCLEEVRGKLAEHGICPAVGNPECKADTVADKAQESTRAGRPAANLPRELDQAVAILKEEYEKTKTNPYIHNPVAWALYHAWRRIDSRRE